ncbi:hypothetical protein JRC04_23080 [Mycolicibacterium sp. S2-37]|uniref:hypothetical protein n=1 Tax=Mycolicibacterium sp. S2-37 TaxID=2810297 RepID=UPI001A941E93|nr:hypothetical protein [Mycolicibacterium sp. S2-37]MBO0680360.1 hypothetical protein [Mycolicibacterium sp. S2-37]
MGEPFIGSEALAAGRLTRHALRSRYVALHQDVYIAQGIEVTAAVRAKAAWLRSRRRGILAGFSAAAVHGSKWIDPNRPATILDTNHRAVPGVQAWGGSIGDDEVCRIAGMRVTSPPRTALDLARRYPLDTAVVAVDALANATRLKIADVDLLVERYRGGRGLVAARAVLDLVDGGAESSRETALRLQLIRAGLPRPQTQIVLRGEYGEIAAVFDMGWEKAKVAVEYDGDHHRTSRRQFHRDIERMEAAHHFGWVVVRVTAADTEGSVIRRVQRALAGRQ